MCTSSASSEPCAHERGHIIDSLFFGNRYATPASRRIFCDVCRLQRWLDVEATLARCQAELGMIPDDAAEVISKAAHIDRLDLSALPDAIAHRSHSLVPLLEALERECAAGSGEWIHYGATTQDIQDTAQSLELRAALDAAETSLTQLRSRLATLALEHRNTLITGRTHGRVALPTTFGLKISSWLDELDRHSQRIQQTRPRVLVAQLVGGVGTMAAFGTDGPELLKRFAVQLGLGVPLMGWHSARDRIAEFVMTLAMIAATCARIADEIRSLSAEPLGEVEIGWRPSQVGSSTMPHKRNPEACEQVVVLARLARSQVPLALDAMMAQEHERDSRGLRLEWPAISDVTHYTLASLSVLEGVIAELRVDAERMAANAESVADSICSEALMFLLAAHVGKQTAHRMVHELSNRAYSAGLALRTVAAEDPLLTRYIEPQDLQSVFEPGQHLGAASILVRAVVLHSKAETDMVDLQRRAGASE